MYLSTPYQGKQFPDFSPLDWGMVLIAACMIAFLSLGAHDLAIAHLGIPYPDESAVPAWLKFSGQWLRIAATVYFCHLAKWYLDKLGTIAAAVLVGTILVLFHETLRIITVDNVLVEGWIDRRWIYMVVQRLPFACQVFFWGAAALVIARRCAGKRLLVMAAAVSIATAVGYFALKPGIAQAGSLLVHAMHLTEPPELYQLPYSFYIYKFIYGAFIEPVCAMFLIVWLAWPGLQGPPARRIAMLAAVTLMMRGRVIASFAFPFWFDQPPGMAMAAEGQFFVETLILAMLTGCVWSVLVRDTGRAGLVHADGKR